MLPGVEASMSDACIFCKIVAGKIPATVVYRDADTLAFMDIGPLEKGHVLVIPRAHHNPLMDTPPDVLAKVMATVRLVARAQRDGLKADGINVTQANGAAAGQVVPHLHMHVIPRFGSDPRLRNWAPGTYASDDELKAYADKLRAALE
jgi:histidine triad (HIT) family protein